jgi:hypothetical protein
MSVESYLRSSYRFIAGFDKLNFLRLPECAILCGTGWSSDACPGSFAPCSLLDEQLIALGH